MLNKRVDKFIRNPKKALFALALPSVVAMTVQTLYNVIDTAFVGHLGVDSIAALTFCFPLFFFIFALGNGIVVGVSALVSQYVGAKNETAAENVSVHGILMSLLFSVLLIILGFLFLKPLFSSIGATGNVLKMALGYMNIIFIGTIFMFPSFVLHGIFNSQGDTVTPMKIHVSAMFLNIILDYIFIYPLGYGVKGAAIATLLAFVFSLGLSIYYLKVKSKLTVNFKSFDFSGWIIKKIFFIGAPASVLMMLLSIYIVVLNYILSGFSDTHVAALGISFRLSGILMMPIVGGAVALLTLVGMFYGAKRNDLVKGIISYAVKISFTFVALGGAIFFIFAPLFVKIFTSDPELIYLSALFLRIDVFILPFLAISNPIGRAMQGLGDGIAGLVFNVVRVVVISIPLTYLFVYGFDYGFFSVPVADVIGGVVAAGVAVVWFWVKMKKLNLVKG